MGYTIERVFANRSSLPMHDRAALVGNYAREMQSHSDLMRTIEEWCVNNCQGEWKNYHGGDYQCWWFEAEEDAVLFKITWA